MKLKALLAGLALCVATTVFAEDKPKPTLNEGVDAAAKTAIEAAQAVNKQAKEANVEWVWAEPQRGLWEGALMNNSDIIEQAIVKANEGKNEEAIKAAEFVKMAAEAGLKQAEVAKTAVKK